VVTPGEAGQALAQAEGPGPTTPSAVLGDQNDKYRPANPTEDCGSAENQAPTRVAAGKQSHPTPTNDADPLCRERDRRGRCPGRRRSRGERAAKQGRLPVAPAQKESKPSATPAMVRPGPPFEGRARLQFVAFRVNTQQINNACYMPVGLRRPVRDLLAEAA
jgi:hypothetical protein